MKIRTFLIVLSILSLLSACRDPSMDMNEYALEDQRMVEFYFDGDDNGDFSGTYEAVFEGSIAYVSLPDGTDRSSLIPRFEIRGKGLLVNGEWQFSGTTAQDFTSAVSYDLVKTDGSRIQYTVVAGYENLSGNSLYEFSFDAVANSGFISETVTGVIDGNDIIFYFPYGTMLADLEPSFVVPGTASVVYNSQVLTSDSAPYINPSDGGTLIVEFDDGTSKGYHVKTLIKAQDAIYLSKAVGDGTYPYGSQMNPIVDDLDLAYTTAISDGVSEIRISAGTYMLTAPLVIDSNIKIKGGYNASDWSDRAYLTYSDRTNGTYRTYIATGDMTAGVSTDFIGNITFSGSNVNASTLLEGVDVMCNTAGYSASVDVENGASPVIRFSTLQGSTGSENTAVSVFDSSPSFYSCNLRGQGTVNNSYGILASGDSEPEVVSCLIEANIGTGAPGVSYGIYLTDGADGVFSNNFIESRGSAAGESASVYLDTSGGEFYNNIFSLVTGAIKERQFWESSSGNTPDVLMNNVFSNTNDGSSELYQKGDASDLWTVQEVNDIGYSGVSDNLAYLFSTETTYETDAVNGMIPPAVASRGTVPDTSWTKDLYGNDRGSSWSIGPVEVDFCSYDTPYLGFNSGADGSYDGNWSSLSISEAIVIANNWSSVEVVYEASGGGYSISNAPEIEISSDLFVVNDNPSVTFWPASNQGIFIIDDGDSGNDIDVYIEGFTFSYSSFPGEKGSAVKSFENTYIYDCIFDSNSADGGGAVYQDGGGLNMANTVFSGNTALNGPGGGLYVKDSEFIGFNLIFTGNTVTTGGNGAAAYFDNTTAYIINADILSNDATATEAAVYADDSDLNVLNSIFNDNSAFSGLADVNVSGGTLALYGSIVESGVYTGWTGVTQTLSAVTIGFNDTVAPIADTAWTTDGNDFHASSNGVTMVDHGISDYIPADWPDADDDGNTSEDFPYDMAKTPRQEGGSVDAGPYESY